MTGELDPVAVIRFGERESNDDRALALVREATRIRDRCRASGREDLADLAERAEALIQAILRNLLKKQIKLRHASAADKDKA
jgi:hypothetical protein